MKEKQTSGRPSSYGNVQITPEFRKEPDMEKLARALIAVALKIAEKKKAEETHGKEDSMV